MIRIRFIPNLLEDKGRTVTEVDYVASKKIKDYLIGYDLNSLKAIVNGKRIHNLEAVLSDNDEIILTPDVKFEWIATFFALGEFWVTVGTILDIAMAVYSIVTAVMAATNRPKRPNYGSLGGGTFEDSPTYGWDGIQTQQEIGTPIAAIYGRHKVGGNRINVFIDSLASSSYSWQDITPSNVNNYGYINTFTTPTVKAIRFNLTAQKIALTFNQGTGVITDKQCFRDAQGAYDSAGKHYSHYKIEYKKTSEGTWTTFKTRVKGGIVIINELDEDTYDVRITLNSANISGLPQDTAYYSNLKGLVNQPAEGSEDKQILNMLIALGEGEIEQIDDIKINDNPIENYIAGEEGPEIFIRKGTNTQSVIPNFADLHNLYYQNVQLTKDNPYVYTTEDNDVEAFELHLQLPSGLFEQDESSGNINSWSVSYKVEYRITGTQDWIDAGTHTISAKSRSTVRRKFRQDGLSPNQYDIHITRISDDSDFYHTGDLYLNQVDEIKTDDLSYPNTVLLGIRALATDQLSGSMPNVSCVVRARKVKLPQIMCQGEELSYDEYYYDNGYKRVIDGQEATWDGQTWVERWSANPIWVNYDVEINKRFGLGHYQQEADIDINQYISMANYADEMVNAGLASGIKEKRFRLDIVLDANSKAPDLITQIANTFRGIPFYSQGLIKLLINKPELPVQLFSMGNIIEGSFQESFSSLRDMPNLLEIQYLDEEKDFERETASIEDSEIFQNNVPIRKKTVSLFGITRKSQAIREGYYNLFILKYLTRSIGYKVGIDAIACQAGEVIEFSHDVPQWGFSGRIVLATIDSIEIDQPLTIENGVTYKLLVRTRNDSLITLNVINSPGQTMALSVSPTITVTNPQSASVFDYDSNGYTNVLTTGQKIIINSEETTIQSISDKTLTVSPSLSTTPNEGDFIHIIAEGYDVYSFGEVTKVTKPFRLVSLQKDRNNEAGIIAIEYNETIYGEPEFVLPTDNYSSLSMEIPAVTNLALTERLVKLGDGTIEDVIDVWFLKPISGNYIKKYAYAKIYLSDDNGVSWQYRGSTYGESFAIQGGIIDLQTYKVCVVSVTEAGEEGLIENSPQAEITVLGKTLPPSDVTGFEVSQWGDVLRYTWDAVPDVDIARYQLRKGPSWEEGLVIAEVVDATEFNSQVGEIGEVTFWVKAIDTSGNESENPTYDIIDISPPPEMNFIQLFDPWSRSPLESIYSADCDYEWTIDYSKQFRRRALILKTQNTWEDLEALGYGWEYLEENGYLTLDRPVVLTEESFEMKRPIDLEVVFEFNVILDLTYHNVTGGSLTVEISYSTDGVNYSNWEVIDPDTLYHARYVKFRFKLKTTDSNHNIRFYTGTVMINAPVTAVDYGRDVAIPVEGKVIQFSFTFGYTPRITANIVNGVIGFIQISNKTVSQFNARCYASDGVTPIGTAEIDWDAKGYQAE